MFGPAVQLLGLLWLLSALPQHHHFRLPLPLGLPPGHLQPGRSVLLLPGPLPHLRQLLLPVPHLHDWLSVPQLQQRYPVRVGVSLKQLPLPVLLRAVLPQLRPMRPQRVSAVRLGVVPRRRPFLNRKRQSVLPVLCQLPGQPALPGQCHMYALR
jgi:hypothetical protein